MTEIFEAAFLFTFGNEGNKLVNDPDDSGGPTLSGITLDDLSRFRGHPCTVDDLKNLTVEEKKEFYHQEYWNFMRLDAITFPSVAIALFDSGVFRGQPSAILRAQKTCNRCGVVVKCDALMGDRTIRAINTTHPEEFIETYHDLYLTEIATVIEDNPKNKKYETGWVKRVNAILKLIEKEKA